MLFSFYSLGVRSKKTVIILHRSEQSWVRGSFYSELHSFPFLSPEKFSNNYVANRYSSSPLRYVGILNDRRNCRVIYLFRVIISKKMIISRTDNTYIKHQCVYSFLLRMMDRLYETRGIERKIESDYMKNH